ncbi:class I SAM-dependent methyltransferase [Nocardioides endophyticus]|uniref:class I SAM-dependent methyltransferase n=1 Tax=Nocardioides endophyticus TaxID=1353775 RepID=UPI0031EDFF9A
MCTSPTPLSKSEARYQLEHGQLMVPNVSGFYHGILKGWWEKYGLGENCLLISETHAVGEVFHKRYPDTTFVTTDYFVDLQPHPTCDVVWDLCSSSVPDDLRTMQSVVCQATLEHIQDPVQVMRNLAAVLAPGGMLYVQTHTPAFHYHGYPKDYLRYFPDWFVDICQIVDSLELVELLCIDGHAFAAYRRTAA